jgi:beta-glucuronidase
MDFRSPRRQNHQTQNFFNRKGIVSEQGVKKQAFFVLQEFYRQKNTK